MKLTVTPESVRHLIHNQHYHR